MYTEQQLTEQIKKLGIKKNDFITVHMSLKSIGDIDTSEKSSAEVFISALKNCVPDGLLVIPSHTYSNIREVPVFNIRETMPCIGAVPTVAVQMANRAYDSGDKTCIRSFHLSHSVVAFGEKAYEFTDDDKNAESPMPEFGCYNKLARYGAKILLVGVGLGNNTIIHAVDEVIAPLTDPYPITAIDYDGRKYQRIARNCPGPWPAKCYTQYEPYLEEAGAITRGKIGDADVMVCDAKITVETILNLRKNGFQLTLEQENEE